MLTSHVRAMAHRSISGEPLPEVDASLFEEISEDSMMLAREVVAQFGNLPDEEAWLLSVHFEVAKDNLKSTQMEQITVVIGDRLGKGQSCRSAEKPALAPLSSRASPRI